MSHVHSNLAKQQKTPKENSSETDSYSNDPKMPLKLKAFVLILLASLMMSYCVTEDGFSGFLMTFSLSRLHWDKETGSYLTTVFWIFFVIGRFCGIFLVGSFRQTTLLTMYISSISVSSVGFLLGSYYNVIAFVWIFTGTLGFSMSIVFPCIFGWTSENILKITGKISSMFLVSAGIGAMLFPILAGYLIEYHSPLWFAYMLVIFSGVTASLYLTIRLITYYFINRKYQNEDTAVDSGKEMTIVKSKQVTLDKDDKLYPILR